MGWRRWLGLGRRVRGLERDDLEGHAEHLGDFFLELSVIADLVKAASQRAPDDLIAEQTTCSQSN
jgi:hypothetical protein